MKWHDRALRRLKLRYEGTVEFQEPWKGSNMDDIASLSYSCLRRMRSSRVPYLKLGSPMITLSMILMRQ